MKIKFKELNKALDQLRYKTGISDSDAEVEICVRQEDPGSGILGECIIITFSVTKQPSQYDDVSGNITTDYALEVFSASENRPPRLVSTETKNLNIK